LTASVTARAGAKAGHSDPVVLNGRAIAQQARLSPLLGLSASQSGSLMPLHSTAGYRPAWGNLWTPPLHFGRLPPQ